MTEVNRGGRPPIGRPIQAIIPHDHADAIDDIARTENRTRAQVLRDIIALGLPAYRRRKQRQDKEQQP